MKAFGWYKKMHDEIMNDPERKARYEECMKELIEEEKMIAKLKRLLFEAVPYIRDAAENAEADHDATDDYSDYERMLEASMLVSSIKEALDESDSDHWLFQWEEKTK